VISQIKQNRQRATKWPKETPRLTEEEARISDDWMQYFHEVNRNRFSGVVNFNHQYVVKHSPPDFTSTLDVGAGLGEHLNYERLTAEQLENYVALEFRQNMANEIRKNWPTVQVSGADCQRQMPFADEQFDRIIAIHVLEHLPNLPVFLDEAHRLLSKEIGRLLVVIPCEGGWAYSLGRQFTSKRMFERRYGLPYSSFIAAEHVNQAREILQELKRFFIIEQSKYYPLAVPVIHLNLCIGLKLRPRADV
jgi:SAM-dependent methyltransferase